MLYASPDDAALRQHRALMATREAQYSYRRRTLLVEPLFGILNSRMGVQRFELRDIDNVKAEWTLLLR